MMNRTLQIDVATKEEEANEILAALLEARDHPAPDQPRLLFLHALAEQGIIVVFIEDGTEESSQGSVTENSRHDIQEFCGGEDAPIGVIVVSAATELCRLGSDPPAEITEAFVTEFVARCWHLYQQLTSRCPCRGFFFGDFWAIADASKGQVIFTVGLGSDLSTDRKARIACQVGDGFGDDINLHVRGANVSVLIAEHPQEADQKITEEVLPGLMDDLACLVMLLQAALLKYQRTGAIPRAFDFFDIDSQSPSGPAQFFGLSSGRFNLAIQYAGPSPPSVELGIDDTSIDLKDEEEPDPHRQQAMPGQTEQPSGDDSPTGEEPEPSTDTK